MTQNIEQRTHAACESMEKSAIELKQAVKDFSGHFIGNYAEGLTFTNRYDYAIKQEQSYKVRVDTVLPFSCSGNFVSDQQFLSVYDNAVEAKKAEVAATASAEKAAQEVINAASQADRSASEANRAESAVSDAAAAANIYKNVADGIAATVSGQLFLVVSEDLNGFSDLFLNSNGAAVYQNKTTANKNSVDNIVVSSYQENTSLVRGISTDKHSDFSTVVDSGAWINCPKFKDNYLIRKIKFKNTAAVSGKFTLFLAAYTRESISDTQFTYRKVRCSNSYTFFATGVKSEILEVDVQFQINKDEFIAFNSSTSVLPYSSSSPFNDDVLITLGANFKNEHVSNKTDGVRGGFVFEYVGSKRAADELYENAAITNTKIADITTSVKTLDKNIFIPTPSFVGHRLDNALTGFSNVDLNSFWSIDTPTPESGHIKNVKFFIPEVAVNNVAVNLAVLTYNSQTNKYLVESIDMLTIETGQERMVNIPVDIPFSKNSIFALSSKNIKLKNGIVTETNVRYFYGNMLTGSLYDFKQTRNSLPFEFNIMLKSEVAATVENRKRIVKLENKDISPQKLFPFDYNMILGAGQSLMEGSRTSTTNPLQTPITTTQEYNTLCYQGGSTGMGGLKVATVDNSQIGGRGEWSGLACSKILRELVCNAKNQPPEADIHPLVVVNHGSGGATLAEIVKGGSRGRFEEGISCLRQLNSTATSDKKTSGVLAIIFMQGCNDHAGDDAAMKVWRESLSKMANDYYADSSVINGQILKPKLFSYQLSTYKNMALNQLEASDEYANIVLAAPIYHLGYYDGLHIHAAGERRMGGYFAKAIYQEQILGNTWQPLRCTDVRTKANQIVLTFNRFGLVLDDQLLAKQTNFGFYVKNGSTDVNIDAVQVINSNQIKLITRENLGDNVTVGYGTNQRGLPYQAGFAGNLRDSSGTNLQIDDYPLHDWCVMFEFEI